VLRIAAGFVSIGLALFVSNANWNWVIVWPSCATTNTNLCICATLKRAGNPPLVSIRLLGKIAGIFTQKPALPIGDAVGSENL